MTLSNSERADGGWKPGTLPYWGVTRRRVHGKPGYWQWTVCGSRGGESGLAASAQEAQEAADRALARLR